MPSVVACVACVSLTCGQGTTQPVPRRLVLLAASLMACPGASALVMRGTRPVITHAGLPCEINSDSNSDGHRRVLLRPCEQEDETYFMPHRIEPRTSRPQAGLLLTSPILVLDRDAVAVRLRVQRPVATMRAVSAPFDRTQEVRAEAMAVVFSAPYPKHYLELGALRRRRGWAEWRGGDLVTSPRADLYFPLDISTIIYYM